MNERIDRIADQIMSEFHDVFGHGDVVVPDEFFERFAELIVRECANLVNSDMDHYNGIAYITPEEIKEHFGVE